MGRVEATPQPTPELDPFHEREESRGINEDHRRGHAERLQQRTVIEQERRIQGRVSHDERVRRQETVRQDEQQRIRAVFEGNELQEAHRGHNDGHRRRPRLDPVYRHQNEQTNRERPDDIDGWIPEGDEVRYLRDSSDDGQPLHVFRPASCMPETLNQTISVDRHCETANDAKQLVVWKHDDADMIDEHRYHSDVVNSLHSPKQLRRDPRRCPFIL